MDISEILMFSIICGALICAVTIINDDDDGGMFQ